MNPMSWINQSRVNLCLSCRASTLSNAVSSLASTGMSFTKVDEREKQAALEEEQARLKALKVALLVLSEEAADLKMPWYCLYVWTSFIFHSGTAAQRALQEALLRYHGHVADLYHRWSYQHHSSHRPLLYTQLLQRVRAPLVMQPFIFFIFLTHAAFYSVL